MSKKQLKHGRFIADLFVNRELDPPMYHYIITADGDPEIVSWGQAVSMATAEREALRSMQQFESKFGS
jgi:hypothetical protein